MLEDRQPQPTADALDALTESEALVVMMECRCPCLQSHIHITIATATAARPNHEGPHQLSRDDDERHNGYDAGYTGLLIHYSMTSDEFPSRESGRC
ncbi:UNVERIFIED_CONTAM: hypothetical protein Sindi_2556900 [Sesamum indicum]